MARRAFGAASQVLYTGILRDWNEMKIRFKPTYVGKLASVVDLSVSFKDLRSPMATSSISSTVARSV
jgi:hypothetical protein